VKLATGATGATLVDMPGDRLVVPIQTSVVQQLHMEPLRARPLDTPGRMLFNGRKRQKDRRDPFTGDLVERVAGGSTGFTGQLWQLGWVGPGENAAAPGWHPGAPVMIAVTADLWVPALAYPEGEGTIPPGVTSRLNPPRKDK
jgi:hypothetical protein